MAIAIVHARRFGNPRPVWNARDRPRESGAPDLIHHELAVHDHAASRFQDSAHHRDAFVIGPGFEFPGAHCVLERGRAAVIFGLAQIGVPIPPLDGHIRDQVMQVRLVHHYHARICERPFIDKCVMRIVADLVERNVELLRMKCTAFIGENFNVGPFPE